MAAMTYLDLCQRLVQESGISGGGPATVVGQTQKLEKVVGWIERAWSDIQLMRPNWDFMWKEFSFDTVAGTRDYLPADISIVDLRRWEPDTFLIYLTSAGASEEGFVEYRSYRRWRREFRAGYTARDAGQPQVVTVLPDTKAIRFEPKPDAIYTCSGEYYRLAQSFTDDGDEPTGFPDDFHMMIVWQALKYYASFEDSPEAMDEAETKFDDLLLQLEREQLPEMSEDYETLA